MGSKFNLNLIQALIKSKLVKITPKILKETENCYLQDFTNFLSKSKNIFKNSPERQMVF
jgi:hypothetical protein